MSEQPEGKMAYGQAGSYDAVDDRAMVAAVTRGRTGLVAPTSVGPGSGLEIIIRGGWLGVASCNDGTSGVVGSFGDIRVEAVPGAATGVREDVVWCDTNPDEGTWTASVIPRAAIIGRPGIPLCWVTVPANVNLASQMVLTPVNATLERRLLQMVSQGNDQTRHTANSWASATGNNLATGACDLEPGHWYRVRAWANAVMLVEPATPGANREAWIGIGQRITGLPVGSSTYQQGACRQLSQFNRAEQVDCEWVFWHGVDAGTVSRQFDTRVWLLGGGTFTPGAAWDAGSSRRITVEDLGS